MKFLKSFVWIQSVMCFIFISWSYGIPVGKFTYVEGKVDLISPGEKAIPVKIGMPISMKDIVRTKSKSKAEITFNDGNILRLAQNTQVEVTQYIVKAEKSFRILSLSQGSIQNIVKKILGSKIGRFGKAYKYEVHTPVAVVGVKGTVFFVFHTKRGSGALFKEGTGYCYARKFPQRIIHIRAGWKVFVSSPTAMPIVKRATKKELKKLESQTSPKKKEEKSLQKKKKPAKKEEQKKPTKKIMHKIVPAPKLAPAPVKPPKFQVNPNVPPPPPATTEGVEFHGQPPTSPAE